MAFAPCKVCGYIYKDGEIGHTCCKNSMMEELGFTIPRILQSLIQRPLTHMLLEHTPGGVRGFLIMEFDNQIFRREVFAPYDEPPCSKCGAKAADLNERYSLEVGKAGRAIIRDVQRVVRVKLSEALAQVDGELPKGWTGRWPIP